MCCIVFEHDSAEISEEAMQQLEKGWFCFSAYSGSIRVTGRTDPLGSSTYNRDLGLARAEAVAAALRGFGLEADRMEVLSEGEAGRGAEDRRRVDVVLVPRSER